MMKTCYCLFIALALTIACSQKAANDVANSAPTPAKVTDADIAKLRWLEGSWRGLDGDKAFFERYRFEGTTMFVDTFEDESLEKVTETSRFELKDGEFGASSGGRRSVATAITENAVQFAPAAGQGNSFRFERQSNGDWHAVLEWPATNEKPAGRKVYEMKRWPPAK